MAFPTDTFTGDAGDLDVFIPAVWGERLNDFFKEPLYLADFFTDRSGELTDGGNIVYTPGLTEMTAYSKSVATAVTLNSPTETAITLTVSNWYEVSFMIEDREVALVKKSYAIQEAYAKNAAFTIATKLEVALASLFSGFSQSVGATSTNLADSEIRNAIATLAANGIPGMLQNGTPKQDVAFFMHPNTFWRQVQNIDKFSLAVNSPVNDPTAKWPSGYLYGIPVFVSPNVQYAGSTNGRVNALAHKDALHWATSSLPATGKSVVGKYGVRVQTNYIPDYLGFLTTADILYGVIENRDAAGVKMLSHATAA